MGLSGWGRSELETMVFLEPGGEESSPRLLSLSWWKREGEEVHWASW